jgi:hypothetical protein
MNPLFIASMRGISSFWMLAWAGICLLILLPIFPLILRRRKRKAHRELHAKIEQAKAKILEDGIIEGPKGPRAKHIPWGSRRTGRTQFGGPPRGNSYDGGPWPQ